MVDDSSLMDALLAACTVALFFVGVLYAAYRVVIWARRQKKRAYVIGAALAPFISIGNVVDPDFRIVQEAKQLKKREEDDAGDPPDPEDDDVALQEVQRTDELRQRGSGARPSTVRAAHVSRPLLARAIALLLSSMALGTLAIGSLILFSDAYGPVGRDVRASFSAVEWASMYLASALLFVSMLQLFRLRRASVWLFAGYIGLGTLVPLVHALTQARNPYLDLRMMFVTVPVGLALLAYMHWLRKQAKLV